LPAGGPSANIADETCQSLGIGPVRLSVTHYDGIGFWEITSRTAPFQSINLSRTQILFIFGVACAVNRRGARSSSRVAFLGHTPRQAADVPPAIAARIPSGRHGFAVTEAGRAFRWETACRISVGPPRALIHGGAICNPRSPWPPGPRKIALVYSCSAKQSRRNSAVAHDRKGTAVLADPR